ncbi:hypothetical protein wcw_0243 [Waddlia chondrophila WSU 86-1044]|uniref:Uncharacterized protein n=1 Tax=Waddlia chondrophila (strain ATCC VR-1470 / WSU 86-1044) TaxID=716544 RepID=D6YU07_WADCW|nr:hypothetical protein wcw_0243 [Waddlia chondrophila WSU 86-1044]
MFQRRLRLTQIQGTSSSENLILKHDQYTLSLNIFLIYKKYLSFN